MCAYKIVKGYSVAPYNFVTLPKKAVVAYENFSDIPKHNEMDDKLLNGYIDYEIKTKTPTIVCDTSDKCGIKEFFKNASGKETIPGSTIRGIVATNLAILSLSNITESISDERFLYRSFGKDKKKDDYFKSLNITTKLINSESVSAPFTMKAGFIYKVKKDEYAIIPSKEINEYSYFRINEEYLRKMNPKVNGINYMYTDEILELIRKKELYKGQQNLKRKKDFLKRIIDKDSKGKKRYQPYCVDISFSLDGKRNISAIGKAGEYHYEGYLMSSEYIDGKLAHYIIPKNGGNENEILFNKVNGNLKYIEFYNDDCLKTKKKLSPNKESIRDKKYFLLPNKIGKENGKAIFYGKFNGMYCFGFSPYVRIPYLYNILDGVSKEYKNEKGISYLESMFGFTNKNLGEEKSLSFKGRVSFQDVVLFKEGSNKKIYNIVAGNPNASACNLYLKQDINAIATEIKNYNSNDFEIRGIKEYWPRDFIKEATVENNKLNIKISPVGENSIFKGRINFKNLKEEELGLLLWSLKVDEKAYETIGLGKPYGFGTVSLENIKVYKENLKLKYFSMMNDSEENVSKEEYIKSYKEHFKNKHSIDLDNSLSVKDLITVKTTLVNKENENEVRYMSLNPKRDFNIYGKNEFIEMLPLPSAVEFKKILKGQLKVKDKVSNNEKGTNRNFSGRKFNDRNNKNNNGNSSKRYNNTRNNGYKDKSFSDDSDFAEAFRKAGYRK